MAEIDTERASGSEALAIGRRAPERIAYRPPELAALLGISGRTLRKWMRDEGLPFLRLDGVVLIPAAMLDAWLAERVSAERRAETLAAEILDDISKCD